MNFLQLINMNLLEGRIVKRKNRSKWEYGVIIKHPEFLYAIKYDNTDKDDIEELEGLPYLFVDKEDYTLKHIDYKGQLIR